MTVNNHNYQLHSQFFTLDAPPAKFFKQNGHVNGHAKNGVPNRSSSPFRRVKITKDDLPPALRDNSYKEADSWGASANISLSAVQGKNFRHVS